MLELITKGKISVVSHGEDLDGIFSASLVLLVQPEGCSVSFSAPYEIKYSQKFYDLVLDLPPPLGGASILIDHHESNLSLASRARISVVKPEYPSTARLLYDLIVEEEPSVREYEQTVGLVDKLDTGDMNYESALFTAAVRKLFKFSRSNLLGISKDLLLRRPVTERDLVDVPSVKREVQGIEREYGEQLSELLNVEGGEALLVEIKSLPSYLVPVIQLPARRYMFFGTITTGSDGGLRVSLRSRDDSPISALDIAKVLGGGGHRNAAGALIMPSDKDRLLSLIGERLKVELISV